MRRPALGYHLRLTLTIAGAFIGAMLVILVLALVAAQNFDVAIVTTTLHEPRDPETPPTPLPAEPGTGNVADIEDPPEPDDPVEPDEAWIPGAIYSVDQDGSPGELLLLPEERLPILIRWSLLVLAVFAVVAVAIASWISRRSLDRIAHITSLARDLSEQGLDQRLKLTGPDDEIRQLGDTFDSMLDRLEQAFASQRLFIANASHELRTPLTTARAALEIPLAQGRVPADLKPSLERALAANRRSEDLIAALLVLARSQLTRQDRQQVDLSQVCRSVLESCRAEASERGLTIHERLAPAPVTGNATLLAEAVNNLVENAVRHNHRDGDVWITLEAQSTGTQLVVENTGVPYTLEAVARLSEPFHRHDATRLSGPETPGVGLGLAIVKGVAEMHGGTLVLAPRPGGGMIATIRFPREPDQTT